ncbi:hypothetical protein G6F66_015249 [Rhizopus arrhizus]|nr:hypothetical protein G6F66_015249 [Rhizopus arrhizus]
MRRASVVVLAAPALAITRLVRLREAWIFFCSSVGTNPAGKNWVEGELVVIGAVKARAEMSLESAASVTIPKAAPPNASGRRVRGAPAGRSG